VTAEARGSGPPHWNVGAGRGPPSDSTAAAKPLASSAPIVGATSDTEAERLALLRQHLPSLTEAEARQWLADTDAECAEADRLADEEEALLAQLELEREASAEHNRVLSEWRKAHGNEPMPRSEEYKAWVAEQEASGAWDVTVEEVLLGCSDVEHARREWAGKWYSPQLSTERVEQAIAEQAAAAEGLRAADWWQAKVEAGTTSEDDVTPNPAVVEWLRRMAVASADEVVAQHLDAVRGKQMTSDWLDDFRRLCTEAGMHLDEVRVHHLDPTDDAARLARFVQALLAPTVVERNAPLDWASVWETAHTEVQWLAEPLVEAGTSVALYSAPKVGKSLLVLDVCAAMASGRPVLGKPAGEPRRVLYLDAENTTADLVERLTAMGYGPQDFGDRLVYVSFPDLGALDTASGGKAVVALAQEHKPDLVVFDTISRFVEGKEDASDTWNAVYRMTLQHLKRLGIAVLRLDHAGKDAERGMRGSSSKASDVDAVWRLEPVAGSQHDGEAVRLVRTHTRNGHGEDKVLLARLVEPLRHLPTGKRVLDDHGKPLVAPAVQRLMDALDRLGVPVEHGRDKASRALAEAGEKASNANLAEAVRVRRLNAGRGGGDAPAVLSDPLDDLAGTGPDRS
jgi:hypothetical protein